ncbi:hypothetical protein PN456_17590 [Nodularia spumigena CS-586/05]|uniref:Uncharacterized protein n=1 Tax=Nodularia spumigena CENA596 TaxID=1819295 RepID=A0A166IZT5_NODSP|nr:hypothetical protein [Nodularia spumigena]KZL49061.1 hypothetical protein A2T98_14795 [Nodularia spumigena CENA596]MDB9345412.1 hypothetical protein [Nodularia spumigena CS-588/06]MDB9349530.1 hypothetical protein [Nodularia spumigena CS-588/01]MDB9351562.1 hypothetical protein [Nodularia spumigena CS-588/05]MDB9370734.1 hypothetical protein [Nodularia spumigena CS-586/05]
MFGFIKKLITGILGFITGLLPGKKGNGYYLELDEPASEKPPATTVNGTKAAASVAVASPAASPADAPAAKSNAPTAKKADKVEPSKNGKAPQAEPATVPAATSNGTKAASGETTFAPKYLAPSGSSSSRRRPGANMSSYLDMARQMKTSN